ncbi:MAG: HAMP domain-containing protein [Candidatus Omnitrophica bacterium]|nr:HAMP domain-containing protein [Candidatus Omnitrophota bacterium]
MPDKKYRRTNYFIKKKFQLKFTFSIVATLLIVMFVSGVGLYMGLWGSIIENFSKFKVSENLENVARITGYEEARFKKGDYRLEKIFREAELLSDKDRYVLRRAMASVNRSLIPKILLLALFLFIGGIFASHKIAGPIYRIEQSAEAIREGDLRVNFHIRKDDELKEAALVLEDMVESLRGDILKIKAISIALEDKIGSVASRLSPGDAVLMKEEISEIYGILSKYKT